MKLEKQFLEERKAGSYEPAILQRSSEMWATVGYSKYFTIQISSNQNSKTINFNGN